MSHWAHDRLLLKVRSGSQAHGLATPESDLDSRGVCVPPKAYLLGLSDFEQWESVGGDHVIFSLAKFTKLALDGNPNIIETLFTHPDDHLFVHPLAEKLLDNRGLFLSQKVGLKFGRYAIHQLQKIERHHRWLTSEPPPMPQPSDFGAVLSENSPRFPDTTSERAYRAAVKHHRAYREWRKNRNPKRALLEEKYGYDTKHAMHLCRLLNMGCEILQGGEVRVRRPDAEWLQSVRQGRLTYPELLQWVAEREANLSQAEAQSKLPMEPDRDKAELLVIEITEQFLKQYQARKKKIVADETSPVEATLQPAELARYDRHITLPLVGLEGQKKLKAAKVLLIGTGGLGSPLGLYLAAAGVGTLGIVDYDFVDESNLHRQIIHGTKDLGRPKIASARERLNDINPHIKILCHEKKFSSENAKEIVADYDIVVDGTDNFATRYLVNDVCVLLNKPSVFGSVFRFEGQVSVFYPAGGGPCYRCLYPDPPPPGLVPSCAEGGVLGVLPGVVGTLQATETLKLILGLGEPLLGRILLFDALSMRFKELKLPRDPRCALCGPQASIKELVDYHDFCGLNLADKTSGPEVSPHEFREQWLKGRRPVLVDVRNPHEWDIMNLEEYAAKLIPLASLSESLHLLQKDWDIVVYCKSGGRSATAQCQLIEAGFSQVRNLSGGILRWSAEVDSSKGKY